MVFGQRGDVRGTGKTRRQRRQRQRASDGVRLDMAQFMPKQPQRPHRHGCIHQTKQHAGADQAELRHQHQRKRQRHGQRAQVVKRQHLRHQLFQRHVAPQNPHDQRNLQPDQRAHGQHQRIQQEAERARHVGIGDKQNRWQRTADQRHHQFDAQKMRRQLALKKPRQPRPNAHRKQVAANDGGKLQHRVAQQIRRNRARRQLVDQPAGGHHKHAGQQRDFERTRCHRAAGVCGGAFSPLH